MSRRLAARLLALAGLAAASALSGACSGKAQSPTGPTCATYAGTYRATFGGTECGRPTETTVVIHQSGCDAWADLGSVGAIQGDIDETSGVWNIEYGSNPPCAAMGGGTASFHGGTTITGSYSGSTLSGSCCGSINVSFTLVRQ